ncbi:HelD family protein [Saccharopolyspora mangrovi]|uniref:AAA family ATPase n=1 Tax=Saccharopolyspora mangrovi TaxID=3082379 RepID=A0ABU6AEV0_9PSEU|nr:UvrD-helicase domain-containing protein [Saccharopolyspora sp. S2-29]MEB3369976.1 AAA family ATPase [Saccharopolyspora sp. S2-29]
MSGDELELEQEHLSELYAHVDALRDEAAERVEAGGDPDAVAVWQAELARLDGVEQGLCFGRLDMTDGTCSYIGRIGVFRDSDDEQLLVDWRAPLARAFYTATAADPQGVRRRRRISTRGRTVVAVDDELLDSDGSEEHLVGEAALLAAVTAERTGRMREIVTTLQAEQDAIIRSEERGILVVQGGPGTGKTAVALHRVAYLLYTHEHLRNRGVLVVGPSRIFLDYIGQVLPGLGENRVVAATIAELRAGVDITESDSDAVRKGSARMAEEIARAISSRVRIPDQPVLVDFEQQRLSLEPETCRDAAAKARDTGLPHNQARLVFQNELVAALAELLVERMESALLTEDGRALDGGSADGRLGAADLKALSAAGVVVDPDDDAPRELVDSADREALRGSLLADERIADALDELWPELTPEEVVTDVIGAAPRTSADVALLDEAASLLGDGAGRAVFGHVVVDEAQELSEMQWRMLMRRCPSRSMTIVGDLAQTGSGAGARSWGRMLAPHVADRWRLAELTVNYRTPSEIMAATAGLLEGTGLRPPRSVRSSGENPWLEWVSRESLGDLVRQVVAEHAEGQLSVIAPPDLVGELAAELGVPLPVELTDAVVVLEPGQAKGLEFDSVLIVEPAGILGGGGFGRSDLYVSMTRATRRLGVVCVDSVPEPLAGMASRERVAAAG